MEAPRVLDKPPKSQESICQPEVGALSHLQWYNDSRPDGKQHIECSLFDIDPRSVFAAANTITLSFAHNPLIRSVRSLPHGHEKHPDGSIAGLSGPC
jgi:hypothetical protein